MTVEVRVRPEYVLEAQVAMPDPTEAVIEGVENFIERLIPGITLNEVYRAEQQLARAMHEELGEALAPFFYTAVSLVIEAVVCDELEASRRYRGQLTQPIRDDAMTGRPERLADRPVRIA
jgi:hypothetical protein